MRKKLDIIHNEKGFSLPYVLLITSIVLLYLTSSIISLHQNLTMTNNTLEQIKAQTLFQMGYTRFRTEKLDEKVKEKLYEKIQLNNSEPIIYQFTYGETKITTTTTNNSLIHIHVEITTTNNYYYSVTKSLNFSSTPHNSPEIEQDNS